VIVERYGMISNAALEEVYQSLLNHAQMLRLEFVRGSGKLKAQLQKDIELNSPTEIMLVWALLAHTNNAV